MAETRYECEGCHRKVPSTFSGMCSLCSADETSLTHMRWVLADMERMVNERRALRALSPLSDLLTLPRGGL